MRILKFALVAVVLVILAAGVHAQDQARTDLYDKFAKNYNKGPAEQATARAAAKEFLEKYGKDPKSDDEKKAVAYVSNWATKYDKAARAYNLFQAINAKKTDEAFAQAKQVFVDNPDDLEAYYYLSSMGYQAALAGNRKNDADTIAYSKKAIEMLDAGKHINSAKPMSEAERANALGYTYFFLASVEAPASATDAKMHFLKAIRSRSAITQDPSIYVSLYNIYNGEYPPLATRFNRECNTEGLQATPGCKDLLTQAHGMIDRMVDVLARAVAYANASATPDRYAQLKVSWLEVMRPFYKQRNNGSDAGMDEFIKGITARPIPD